ncbi:hypothetical protein BVI2075_1030038 [Burkholderia vietnamiensis]|nr:hypothetical protein BVI2075_1030038 [Burkholderia vietnamiensis]
MTPGRALARAACCAAKSVCLDITDAMRRGMHTGMNNRKRESPKMFYVSAQALSCLSRDDYLRAEMFGPLMWRFTWGKR